MRVLITGAAGQLGYALVRSAPPTAAVKSVDRSSLDIADATAVRAAVDEFRPTLIINAAAYTAVDQAETDSAAAGRTNALAPGILAAAAHAVDDCRLLHVSTDYVFPGDLPRPCAPGDATNPLGVYGRTKLEGEHAVLGALGHRAVILRTAWVYGPHGKNFLLTMLRLMRERGSVRVVADQIGCPTSTASLAGTIWAFAAHQGTNGIYHWSDAGVASWYDFAVAIAEEGLVRGLVPEHVTVHATTTAEYPTPARRPGFSLLDSSATGAALGITQWHWRSRLRQVMDGIARG